MSEVNNSTLGLGTEDACKLPEPRMALARHALCTVTNPFVVLMRFEVFGWEVYKLQICSFQTNVQPDRTHGYYLVQEPDQDMVEQQFWGWTWWGAAVHSLKRLSDTSMRSTPIVWLHFKLRCEKVSKPVSLLHRI